MLKGNQRKLDLNKNGKLDSQDFKMLRGERKMMSGGHASIYGLTAFHGGNKKTEPKTPKEGEAYLKDLKPGDLFSIGSLEYKVTGPDKDGGVRITYADGKGWMTWREDSIVTKMKTGGTLKPIPKHNKGLPNLPEKVRNNMGYMATGGGVGRSKWKLTIDLNPAWTMIEDEDDLDSFIEGNPKEWRMFTDKVVEILNDNFEEVEKVVDETDLNTYQDVIDYIYGADDVQDFDYEMGRLYDIADENKIFIKTMYAKKGGMMKTDNKMKKGGKSKAPKRSAHSIEMDSNIKAKKPGRRVSESGNVYYESRPEHSDENRKKKPYLEQGGQMKKGGKAKAPKRSAHSIEMDSMIKAKKPGRRVSASGNVYYESRPEHSDENRKKKPYLEEGGKVKGSSWSYSIGGLGL